MSNLIRIENNLLLLPQVKIGDAFYDVRIEKFGTDRTILPFEEGDWLESDVNKIRELAVQAFAQSQNPIEYKHPDENAPESVRNIYEIISPQHPTTLVCLDGKLPAFIRVEAVLYTPLTMTPREAAPPLALPPTPPEEKPKFDVARLTYQDLERYVRGEKRSPYLEEAHTLFTRLMENPEDATNPLRPWLLAYCQEQRNQNEVDPAIVTRFAGPNGIDPKPLEQWLLNNLASVA